MAVSPCPNPIYQDINIRTRITSNLISEDILNLSSCRQEAPPRKRSMALYTRQIWYLDILQFFELLSMSQSTTSSMTIYLFKTRTLKKSGDDHTVNNKCATLLKMWLPYIKHRLCFRSIDFNRRPEALQRTSTKFGSRKRVSQKAPWEMKLVISRHSSDNRLYLTTYYPKKWLGTFITY